jgi:phosphohistidine phosphatase SixA
MRHCLTDDGDQEDSERTLNEAGEMQAHAIRKFLKRARVRPDVIICSDYARAEDTAKAIRRGDTPIETSPFLRPNPAISDKYIAKAWKTIAKLAGDAKSVLVVTHGPLIQRLAAAVAFNFVDETWHWEHGAVAYINTSDNNFRWFVTAKLAAHLTRSEDPKDVEDPIYAKELAAFAESLRRGVKAEALNPLKQSLQGSVARRFRRQRVKVLRAIAYHARNWDHANYGEVRQQVQHAISRPDPKFDREYASLTSKARAAGRDHVSAQLQTRASEAKQPTPAIAAAAIGLRTGDDVAGELDKTTSREVDDLIGQAFDPTTPITIGELMDSVRERFKQYADGIEDQKPRAQTVAEYEISDNYHQGGKEAAAEAPGDVEKSWDIGDEGCPICEANAEQGWIPADESFDSGDDEAPAHPNCDCSVDYRNAETEE